MSRKRGLSDSENEFESPTKEPTIDIAVEELMESTDVPKHSGQVKTRTRLKESAEFSADSGQIRTEEQVFQLEKCKVRITGGNTTFCDNVVAIEGGHVEINYEKSSCSADVKPDIDAGEASASSTGDTKQEAKQHADTRSDVLLDLQREIQSHETSKQRLKEKEVELLVVKRQLELLQVDQIKRITRNRELAIQRYRQAYEAQHPTSSSAPSTSKAGDGGGGDVPDMPRMSRTTSIVQIHTVKLPESPDVSDEEPDALHCPHCSLTYSVENTSEFTVHISTCNIDD